MLLSSVITAAALVHPAWASSGQQIVHASVFVICPYAVSVTPNSPVFVIPTNIVLFYSANTLADCSIPSASGTLVNFVLCIYAPETSVGALAALFLPST